MNFSAPPEPFAADPLTRSVLNACSAPSALIDNHGRVLLANSALQSRLPLKPGDDVALLLDNGADIQQFFRTVKRNRRLKHFGRKLQPEFDGFVATSSRVDGSERRWLIELQPGPLRQQWFCCTRSEP